MADTSTSRETALLLSRIGDMSEQCRSKSYPVFLGFLDTAQQTIASQSLKYSGLSYRFWGGYDDAERVCLGIFPGEIDLGFYPIRCLEFVWRPVDVLSHRDFLGSFMGLRLKREAVGDICLEAGRAVAFLSDHAATLILREVTKIGRVGTTLREIPVGGAFIERRFAEISGTAASLRLDCIVALLGNLSRTAAAKLITSGLVAINGMATQSCDKNIVEGDKISIRGTGKFIYDGLDGVSRKDRLRLRFKKYQ